MNETKSMDAGYYLCNPKKNTSCSKEECFMNGGNCRYTCHKEFSLENPSNKEKVIDIFKNMDDEYLAKLIEVNDIFVCDHNCLVQKDNNGQVCPEGVLCFKAICEWLKKED